MRRLLLASGLALLAACQAPPGGVLRVGADVDAESLDPRRMRNTTSFRVVNLIYDGLVQLDRRLVPGPGLAESWENPEPTTWVFHLREKARFHDGEAVTADDVVYTFETLLDPDFKAPLRSLYTPIARVEAVGPRTVRLTLSEPYAPLLYYLDVGIVPRHRGESGDLDSQAVGSGPYRLRRWEKGSRIVLEASSNFWGGTPELARIEFVVVPDNVARAQAFEAGDLELIQSPLSPRDIKRLAGDSRFAGKQEPGLALTYFNFNCARPHLSDARLRRALAQLIDQPRILERIYEGIDEQAASILLPVWAAWSAEIQQPRFDPKGAKALLAELGWRDSDGDGFLDREGTVLSVELGTHSEDVNRVETLEYVQNTFRRQGVESRVRISDWPSFSVRRDSGDYDIILLGWTQLLDPDRVMFDQFHSRGGLNWGKYRNPRLDSLLERGRSAASPEERLTLYREAARLIAEEVPYYILSYQAYHVFYDRRIRGFEPDPRGMLRSLAGARFTARE
jgi:peptide/nickel transport system substrate-binding protein